MRVIVAGSPDWPYETVVHAALEQCAQAAQQRRQPLTVVHGHRRAGAEAMADAWTVQAARRLRHVMRPERHPIRWAEPCRDTCRPGHRRPDPRGGDGTGCPAAAFHATDDMIQAGAELLLAFYGEDTRNVDYAVKAAEAAGIDWHPFRA